MSDETSGTQEPGMPPASPLPRQAPAFRPPRLSPESRAGLEALRSDPRTADAPESEGDADRFGAPLDDDPAEVQLPSSLGKMETDGSFKLNPTVERAFRDLFINWVREVQNAGIRIPRLGEDYTEDGVYYQRTAWDNVELRRKVEASSCEPIQTLVDDSGRFYQVVRPFPGVEIRFRSMLDYELDANEDWVRKNPSAGPYKQSSFLLACSLDYVRSPVLPGGEIRFREPAKLDPGTGALMWDREAFEENLLTVLGKVEKVEDKEIVRPGKLPPQLIKMLLPQMMWFMTRVDRFTMGESLGNC